MPRCVRNFFLKLRVDGKKTEVSTGPRGKTGGFRCRLLMRSGGEVHNEEVILEGQERDGLLHLTIYTNGGTIFTRTTKR